MIAIDNTLWKESSGIWEQVDTRINVDNSTDIDKIAPEKNYTDRSLKRAFVLGVSGHDNPYAKNPYSPDKEEFKAWIEGRAYGLS